MGSMIHALKSYSTIGETKEVILICWCGWKHASPPGTTGEEIQFILDKHMVLSYGLDITEWTKRLNAIVDEALRDGVEYQLVACSELYKSIGKRLETFRCES